MKTYQRVPVRWIHGSRADSYQHLIVRDVWLGRFLELANIGWAVCVSDDRSHRARPPLIVRTTFPVFCSVSTYLVASTTCSNR